MTKTDNPNIDQHPPHHPTLLTVSIPLYNSEKNIQRACQAYVLALENAGIPFEMLLFDDGSKDNTWPLMQQIAAADPRVRIFRMSRNYTPPYLQFAAMSMSRGACITFMPDDLQRPVETMVKCYQLWQEGHKLVIPYRDSRDDGWWSDLFSSWYYRIMNRLSDVRFPPGGADGYLADREIIDIMRTRIHPIRTSAMIEILRLGFDPLFFPYDRPARRGRSRWTWRKKVRLAKDTFFASSSFPIRAITSLGLGIATLSLLLIPLLVYARFFARSRLFGFPIPGWTTIVTLVAFFNGLMLFCLGIVAEYIWRIYEEVKARPGFIIRQDTPNPYMEDTDSRNRTKSS